MGFNHKCGRFDLIREERERGKNHEILEHFIDARGVKMLINENVCNPFTG